MRKELTWISYALLSSVLIVFIVFGNSTLDLRFQDKSIILPGWAWFIPVFLLLCFVIFFFRVIREGLVSRARNMILLILGLALCVVLQIMKSYFQLLDDYLSHGQLVAVPLGGKTIWYSRNTLTVITAFQIFIALALIMVIYFWITRKKPGEDGKSQEDRFH